MAEVRRAGEEDAEVARRAELARRVAGGLAERLDRVEALRDADGDPRGHGSRVSSGRYPFVPSPQAQELLDELRTELAERLSD